MAARKPASAPLATAGSTVASPPTRKPVSTVLASVISTSRPTLQPAAASLEVDSVTVVKAGHHASLASGSHALGNTRDAHELDDETVVTEVVYRSTIGFPAGASISSIAAQPDRRLRPVAAGSCTERSGPQSRRSMPSARPLTSEDALGVVCNLSGQGLQTAKVRTTASFTIRSIDHLSGEPRAIAGESFFVAIRGAARVRAKVTDNEDGTYLVEYKPSCSGHYSIAVSLWGHAVPGSPFALTVVTPSPIASMCQVSGESLTQAVARNSQSFEIRFRDAQGGVAHAEDLDVYVEPLEDSSTADDSGGPQGIIPSVEGAKGSSTGAAETTTAQPVGITDAASDERMDAASSDLRAAPPRPPKLRLSTFVKTRVEVRSKPLVVRASPALDSDLIGQLPAGQLLYVLEEELMSDGSVRALVSLIDEEVGRTYAAKLLLHPDAYPYDALALDLAPSCISRERHL